MGNAARLSQHFLADEAAVDAIVSSLLAKKGDQVLEIGPGPGRWSVALRRRASELILVDVSPRALDLCRWRFAGATDVS